MDEKEIKMLKALACLWLIQPSLKAMMQDFPAENFNEAVKALVSISLKATDEIIKQVNLQ